MFSASSPTPRTSPTTLLLLNLRAPRAEDEEQVREAQQEMAADGFDFMLSTPDQTWDEYLAKIGRDRDGIGLVPGRVPATMLLAVVGDQIVGRVHIRHQLTEALVELGGHIGYGVRPGFRRRGYAAEILRQSLQVVQGLGVDRALVTCDGDNPGSIGTIERCGGVLEDTRPRDGGKVTRRYWIDLA